MLILDGKTISAKNFCERFGIDYDKIVKSPVFEMGKKYKKQDRFNKAVTKVPARVSIPCKTFIRDKATGEVMEFIYAANRSVRTVNKEQVTIYTPKYAFLDAEKTSFKGDIDKAVYMYANVGQFTSPFSNGKNPDFEHVDPTARALSKLNSLSNIGVAMNKVNDMSNEDIELFARGLKVSYADFNPFVNGSDTDVLTLKAELLNFAQLKATEFLELLDNEVLKIKGQIVNLVDKEIIKIFTSSYVRQWKWDKGNRVGQPIGDQIVDPHADAMAYLLNYMQSNISTYYDAIIGVNNTLSAEAQAAQFLKDRKEGGEPVVGQDNLVLPITFDECRNWMAENGFKKTPGNIKKLELAIAAGDVNLANIKSFVREIEAG